MATTADHVIDLALKGLHLMIWGQPGVGKTSSITAAARRRGMEVVVIDATTVDPTALTGTPWVVDGVVDHRPHRQMADLAETGGLLLLDELTVGPQSTQNAMLALLGSRRVGNIEFGENVAIIALSNPPGITGGRTLTAPVANRLMHLDWEPSLEAWHAANAADFGADNEHLQRVNAALYDHAATLFAPTPPMDALEAGKAWPSPRTWSQTVRALNAGIPPMEAAQGNVGTLAAAAVVEFLSSTKVPPLREALANPTKFTWNDLSKGELYSVVSAARAVADADTKVHDQVWPLIAEIVTQCGDASVPALATEVAGLVRTIESPAPPVVWKAFSKVLSR